MDRVKDERLIWLTDAVRLFKALGDESRLRIIRALFENTFCVCDLAAKLGIAQPTLSHHLKVLREVGLVNGEKKGPWIYCTLNEDAFAAMGIDIRRLLSLQLEGADS